MDSSGKFYRDESKMAGAERDRAVSRLKTIYATAKESSCSRKRCSNAEHILARKILEIFEEGERYDREHPVRVGDGYT
jgi:ribosomal protein S19E (S16A)